MAHRASLISVSIALSQTPVLVSAIGNFKISVPFRGEILVKIYKMVATPDCFKSD